MATYMNRTFVVPRRVRRRTASAELVYLLVVVAAAVGTGFWMSHVVGMDLSVIRTAASVLGLTEADHRTNVGYVATNAAVAAAPNCAAGQTPAFSPAVATLAAQIGDASIGTPLECEHPVSATGDTVQQTSTGLVARDNLRGTVSFTDGWRHWAVTARGFVTWQGTDSLPPN